MKDSQQESHTEPKEEESKLLDYFYNEQGDYTLTMYDQPVGVVYQQAVVQKWVNAYAVMKRRIDTLTKANQELYAKLQKIKALTTEIR